MNKDQISSFTRRITQSNKSELICVLFDIFFTYMNAAKDEDSSKMLDNYRHAFAVLEHLKSSLNFKYEIAMQLFPIYDYCERMIAKAMYKGKIEELDAVEEIMHSLADAFKEVAKSDGSESVMQNAQKITAGYTYGRNDVNEDSSEYDSSRGFLA